MSVAEEDIKMDGAAAEDCSERHATSSAAPLYTPLMGWLYSVGGPRVEVKHGEGFTLGQTQLFASSEIMSASSSAYSNPPDSIVIFTVKSTSNASEKFTQRKEDVVCEISSCKEGIVAAEKSISDLHAKAEEVKGGDEDEVTLPLK